MIPDLIERLEKASGPDGELNAYIWLLILPIRAQRCYWNASLGLPKPIPATLPLGLGRNALIANAPHYTKSIDDALTMLPKGHEWEIGSAHLIGVYWAAVINTNASFVCKGAPTPAIALDIAILRAIEATARSEGKHG